MKSLAFAVGRNDQTFAGLHLQAPTARLAQPGFWYATKIGGHYWRAAPGSPPTSTFSTRGDSLRRAARLAA